MKYRYSVPTVVAALAALSSPFLAQAQETVTTTNKWQSSVAAGLTLTRGNSDTELATLSLATGKKWGQNELNFGADGTYGKTKQDGNDDTTAESLHGFGQYNRLFTERLYGYGRIEGLHDGVADIRYRLSLSPGLGYYFIKTKPTQLSAEAGPGFIVQKLGGDKQQGYATLRVGEKFNQTLSDRARLWETAEWLPQVDKFENYIVNFEIGIEADISSSKKLSLRSFLQDTYNHEPAKGREKNDAKLVTAIAYKF
jgi:putative salt-induced outer membrane protein YdiY